MRLLSSSNPTELGFSAWLDWVSAGRLLLGQDNDRRERHLRRKSLCALPTLWGEALEN